MVAMLPHMRILSSQWAHNERRIIRERHGSVLSRGLVLKRDRAAMNIDDALEHAIALEGAPLFREADMDKTNSSIRMPSILMLMNIIMVPIIIVIPITHLCQSMEQTFTIQTWGQLKTICRIWSLSTLTLRRHGVQPCPLTRIQIKHRRDSWVRRKI